MKSREVFLAEVNRGIFEFVTEEPVESQQRRRPFQTNQQLQSSLLLSASHQPLTQLFGKPTRQDIQIEFWSYFFVMANEDSPGDGVGGDVLGSCSEVNLFLVCFFDEGAGNVIDFVKDLFFNFLGSLVYESFQKGIDTEGPQAIGLVKVGDREKIFPILNFFLPLDGWVAHVGNGKGSQLGKKLFLVFYFIEVEPSQQAQNISNGVSLGEFWQVGNNAQSKFFIYDVIFRHITQEHTYSLLGHPLQQRTLQTLTQQLALTHPPQQSLPVETERQAPHHQPYHIGDEAWGFPVFLVLTHTVCQDCYQGVGDDDPGIGTCSESDVCNLYQDCE